MTKFSQQHYKAIASIVWRIEPADTAGVWISREKLIAELCYMFKLDNPKFDTDRFLKAIDGENNPEG